MVYPQIFLKSQNFYYRTTAEFAFHETGHFLGLYHTTERDFAFNDVIDDTPNCRPEDDANDNGEADIEECPDGLNPVFWDNDLDPNTAELLTDDQKQVIFYSPIARP